jgi:carboxyl-terminal processing protease
MRRAVSHIPALLFAAVLVAASFSVSTSRAETPAPSVRTQASEPVDLPKLFDMVVETIDRRFVDVELLKTLDWQARAKAVRSSVLSAATTEDAVEQINNLIAELNTSHTGLYTPDDYRYYITLDALNGAPGTRDLISERFWGTGPYLPGIGVFTRKMDGHHFIDGVLEGSPADKAGLKFGDEILSVDGHAYSPVAAFRGKLGRVADIAVRRAPDATPEHHAIPVIPIVPSVAFADAAKASARVIEKEGRRIGYIHLWSINESRSFRTALATLNPEGGEGGKALDALIVDIRGRVGGNTGTASHMLDILGTAPKPYWGPLRFIDRSGKENASQADTSRSQAKPFPGRTALLIDHQTRSAGEIMAFGYKRSGFGTVFGTPTAGAVTSGMPVAMPGGFMLYVAASSLEFDGQRLEGVGVAPDHRIERPLPYAAGADPVLDAAVEHLVKAGPAEQQ